MNKKKNKILSESLQEFKEPMVSLFGNYLGSTAFDKIPIKEFLFTKKYRSQVETYRESKDSTQRDRIKMNLECITPSSTCRYRHEDYFKKHEISEVHTGLICIDIDSKDNRMIDLASSKHIIGKHCSSLYYAGLSLGGEGIFLIFRISNPEHHREHFEALSYYLNEKFGLNVDAAVKSPVSLRVVSYDDSPYYNPNPAPFQHIIRIGDKVDPVVRTVTDKNKIRESVERAVEIIWKKRVDITDGYDKWFKIGCALAHEFGEDGRTWFHMISRMHNDFHETDCDMQYNRCLKYRTESGVKIGTFFYYCKKCGIKYLDK